VDILTKLLFPGGTAGNIIYVVTGLILYLAFKFRKDKARSKSLPAIFTILGVLGTFFGIALGLAEFDVDPDKIEESVALLLEGLKFAFTTSIIGIFAAVFFRIYNLLYAPADDSTDEAEEVIQILKNNNELTEKIAKGISGDGDASITTQIGKLRNDYRDMTGELVTEFRAFAEKQSENNMKALVEAIETVIGDFNAKINEQFGENFKQLNVAVGKLLDWQENYYEQIKYMVDTIENTQKGVESSQKVIEEISNKYSETYKLTEQFETVLKTLNEENAVLVKNVEEFAKLSDKANEAMPTIEKRIDDLTLGFSETISSNLKTIEKSHTDQTQLIDKKLEELTIGFTDMITANLQSIVKAHQQQADDASNMFKEFKTDLEGSFKGVSENINQLSSSVEKEIKNTIQTTNSEIKEQITETYKGSFKRLEEVQAKMSEDLNSSIMKIDGSLSNMLTNSLNSMSSQLVTLSGKFVTDYAPLTNRLREIVEISRDVQTSQRNQQSEPNDTTIG